jgi:raffinose/stachyose/melibiose transport system permease protein
MNDVFKSRGTIFTLVAPGILIFLFAVLAPIILSVYYGMTDYNVAIKPTFIGLENYIEILHDAVFWKSLVNCLYIAIGLIFVQHPLAFGFAVLLDKVGGRLEKFFRAAYFIPAIIPVAVVTSMWKNIFNPQFGLLNKVLDLLNAGSLKMDWLGNPNTAMLAIIFISIWYGFGWVVLIYYAGIKGIPEELNEAAYIDGAGKFRTMISVTIPLLTPVIVVGITLAIIAALKAMTIVYLTTNGSAGNTTQVVANYFYKKAFLSGQYGYGNAMSVLFVIVCLGVTGVFNRLTKQVDE